MHSAYRTEFPARPLRNLRSEAQSFAMISAQDALARLREGNGRFVANESTASPLLTPSQRLALTNGQEPFAIVLGCSDSRVPAELVFDQGFGDLFVIRVAGNIVAPSRSEEHTSELQSQSNLVCRLLLEKKKKNKY